MRIRFFVIGCTQQNANKSFDGILHSAFSEYLTDNGAVEYYLSVKDATVSISKAVADSQVIVFLSAESCFGETKSTLCSAFNLSTEVDRVILQMALLSRGNIFSEDDEFCNINCSVPVGAKAIVCDDGLFAGFASVRGNQTLILLPYAQNRTAHLLADCVVPMLNSSYSVNINPVPVRHMYAYYLAECVKRQNARVALARTSVFELFNLYVEWNDTLKNSIVVSNRVEKRGDLPPADYVVSQSITAAELMGTEYGVSLSNAFYIGDDPSAEKVVYMAVTNAQETTIREVYSVPNEDLGVFMNRCCGELCTLLASVMDVDSGILLHPVKNSEKKAVLKYKNMIALVVAVTLLIAVGGGIYFAKKDYSLKDWYSEYIKKDSTTELTTLPPDTTAEITTEAGV